MRPDARHQERVDHEQRTVARCQPSHVGDRQAVFGVLQPGHEPDDLIVREGRVKRRIRQVLFHVDLWQGDAVERGLEGAEKLRDGRLESNVVACRGEREGQERRVGAGEEESEDSPVKGMVTEDPAKSVQEMEEFSKEPGQQDRFVSADVLAANGK